MELATRFLDPFFDFDIDPFFSEFGTFPTFPRTRRRRRIRVGKEEAEINITCNLRETSSRYIVEAELPGCKKDDIHLSIRNDKLEIAGEFKKEKEEEGELKHMDERLFGKFKRLIPLPKDADVNSVKAEYKDGILYVYINKKSETKTHSITIT